MKVEQIASARLMAQQLSRPEFTSVKKLVGYLGAVQSQDYMMARLAIALRLKEAGSRLIDKAIINGDIIRTHVLRPTWHFVSSDDLQWMLDLTASRIKASMNGRHDQMGLSSAVFKKCKKIISEALAGNNHLTRNGIMMRLNNAGIKTDLNRASHIFAEAELSGLICSGIPEGNKQTYALISERLKNSPKIKKEEAMAKLARIYFISRGPASVKDFAWWAGLTLTQAKSALEMVKSELSSVGTGENIYWYSAKHLNIPEDTSLHLLPAFDEYLIGYTDRSAVLNRGNAKKYVTLNGMFFPIIVFRGQVIGTWKRTIVKDIVSVNFKFFSKVTKKIRTLAEARAENLADFMDKKLRLY